MIRRHDPKLLKIEKKNEVSVDHYWLESLCMCCIDLICACGEPAGGEDGGKKGWCGRLSSGQMIFRFRYSVSMEGKPCTVSVPHHPLYHTIFMICMNSSTHNFKRTMRCTHILNYSRPRHRFCTHSLPSSASLVFSTVFAAIIRDERED